MSMATSPIRSATIQDASSIAGIYNHYVSNTIVTFEEVTVAAEHIRDRIADVQAHYPWLVYEQDGSVIGYAYASPMHARRSYRYSVETTVYLAHDSVGKGVGSQLYSELLHLLKQGGYHTAIGAIALPNERSIALHQKLGFRKTGHHQEVGWKFDRWVDVGYWQLMLQEKGY